MNQSYKAILSQYALSPSLPTWGDLEGWSRDPMFEKYPSISPYTYCANNPMKFVDPTGMEAGSPSTHTDENGNVIAVYNDGDLGVYAHSKSEIDAYKKDNSKKLENNPDQYKGATLDENSFKKGDKIDFGSYNAKKWIDRFEKYNKNVVIGGFAAKLAYALNAINGGIYDPKSYMKNGSQISEGVYVSPRDLGNFAAGAFGRLSGMNKHRMLAGFGAFNLSGNSIITFMTYFNKACELGSKDGTYGELPISNFFQRLGYENIRTLDEYILRSAD